MQEASCPPSTTHSIPIAVFVPEAAVAASTSAKPSTSMPPCRCAASLSRTEDKRYEGVVASAVMRAMFPKDAARRAFLKSVGASTALAAISQFFPLQDRDRSVRARRRAREEGPQGRLHSDHLRDADHHGAPDGLLFQARPQRRSGQDRRLGRDPRQDHQQGIRRSPHAGADADRDHAGRSAPTAIPFTVPAIENINGQAHHARRSSTRTSAIRRTGRA